MKKIKNFLFAFAFVFALAGAFAFNMPETGSKAFTVYHYELTSTDFEDMKEVSNWEAVSSPGDCGAVGSIPCAITYTGGNFTNYLANDLGDAAAIISAADTRRTP